jgi:transposase InsO family protein
VGERLRREFQRQAPHELLEHEQFDTLLEAKVLIERWRRRFNAVRPHSSLGYQPPAPEASSLVRSLRLRLRERKRLALGLVFPPKLTPT